MITIKCTPNGTLVLGFAGENVHRRVEFDVASWLLLYPDAAFTVLHKAPGTDAAYPAMDVELEGNKLYWNLTSGDLSASGSGEVQYVVRSGEEIVGKSVAWKTYTQRALDGSATPPDSWTGWQEKFLGLRDEAVEAASAAQDAQEAAETARERAETAQHGAEAAKSGIEEAQAAAGAFAQAAATARQGAETAQGAAETARSDAVTAKGKAEDAQHASETARGKAEDAQQAAETAQGKAEDAQQAVENAQTGAENARRAAENAQRAAENAQQAAETAQGKAEDAQSASETAQGKAEDAREAAEGARDTSREYRDEVVETAEGIAQQTTAEDIAAMVRAISGNLEELVEINRSIRYYDALPEEGTEGYTYITPDGVYHYAKGEYIQVSGSGDLNGFSLSLDAGGRVLLSYVNPEDETDTAEAVMPTDTTGQEILSILRDITASMRIWASRPSTTEG